MLNMVFSNQCTAESACGAAQWKGTAGGPVVTSQQNQQMLVISILFRMLLEPPHLGIACLHSVKRLARSIVAYMRDSVYLHFVQALQCMQQTKQ